MSTPQDSVNAPAASGGPSGGQLEAKIGAFYLLAMLAEVEPRGLPGAVATRIKFQRGYEGHALDDIIVEAVDAAAGSVALEIQAKRTLDFTPSDEAFRKVVRQVVASVASGSAAPIAAAVGRSNAKIDRPYQALLTLARKTGSGADLRRALDAPRVVSAGMRDFAAAFQAHLQALGADASDEALWSILRRFLILVFDFESPGAVSTGFALTLARLALPPEAGERAADLWSALIEKALSYDADGGDLDRAELVRWLREERGIGVRDGRDLAAARRRFVDHSRAALDAIDDTIAGVTLDRSARLDDLASALERGRYVEIVGASGVGKSAVLKALVDELRPEAIPLVLSPARTPPGGWLALSRDLGFTASATDFLTELAASGATMLLIDSIDRFADPTVQATIIDLLIAAARVPGLQVVVTVGPDFDDDQRRWLPAGALDLLGRSGMTVGALSDAEADQLAKADKRLGQLLANRTAKELTRNLYQLRQLLQRAGEGELPLSEAGLAQTWWSAAPSLARVQQRDRVRTLRDLADQVLAGAAQLNIEAAASAVIEDLIRAHDLVELTSGATAAFKHDALRDWAGANRLREDAARLDQLPLASLAPIGLGRSLELYARMLIEDAPSDAAWAALVARLQQPGVHGSWLRLALLALVRSEQSNAVLNRAFAALAADDGALLKAMIRHTIAADSELAVEKLVAAGFPRQHIPETLRIPTNWSWIRLCIWLLERLDDVEVPIGADVVTFFSDWLTANVASDPFRPLIVQHLYRWLTHMEGRPAGGARDNTAALFRDVGSRGRNDALIREIRGLFLSFCDQNPDLAAAYLAAHTQPDLSYDAADEILKFSQGTSKAAPAALAAFVVETLISTEERHRRQTGIRGRLELTGAVWLTPGPSKGPFLGILRANAGVGLRLVRRIVDYAVYFDRCDPRHPPVFSLQLGGSQARVNVHGPNAYFLSRDLGAATVATSALRALETWAHEQVEAGRPLEDVLQAVLGSGDISAAYVAVAVDVLLSHASPADPLLIPFGTSAELLGLDWERYIRDTTGLNGLQDDDPAVVGQATNASLAARPSRESALSWAMSRFMIDGSSALGAVLALLQAERDRLVAAGADPSAQGRGPLWHAEHTLRMLDRSNWRAVSARTTDGEPVTALEYVEPPEEADQLAPLRADSGAGLAETLLIANLVDAALDPDKRSDDLLDRGLAWAQAQPLDLVEDENDFDRSQRWRAVVATACLTLLPNGRPEVRDWARGVLRRAVEIDPPDRAYQIRFDALALSVIGWSALEVAGDVEARGQLLRLAGRERTTLITALGGMLNAYARTDARVPKALIRIGLTAAIRAEQIWDDKALTAARQAERAQAVAAAADAEAEWLAGGHEPSWPGLPPLRRPDRRPGARLPRSQDEEDDLSEPHPEPSPGEAIRDDVWLNHQSAGRWLDVLERSGEVRGQPWIADLVAAYRAMSDQAWGLGLPESAQSSHLPTDWLNPFDRLRLRVFAGAPNDVFEAEVCRPLVDLPDQAFLESASNLIPALDSLFFDERLIGDDRLVATRGVAITRLMACRDWRWDREVVSDRISRDLMGAIAALFMHQKAFGLGACYLPAGASDFAGIVPGLLDLVRDAPGRGYVASHFLSLAERAQAWIGLDLVAAAAECWLAARPQDTGFWRDQATGRRLCALFAAQESRLRSAAPGLRGRVRSLIERLILIGVPEALPLEARLSQLA